MRLVLFEDAFIDDLTDHILESNNIVELDSSIYALAKASFLNYLYENIDNNFTILSESHGVVAYPLFEEIEDDLYFHSMVNETAISIIDNLLYEGPVGTIVGNVGKRSFARSIGELKKQKSKYMKRLDRYQKDLESLKANREKWRANVRKHVRRKSGQGIIKRNIEAIKDRSRPYTVKGREELDSFKKSYIDREKSLLAKEYELRKKIDEMRLKIKTNLDSARFYGFRSNQMKLSVKFKPKAKNKRSGYELINASYALDQFDTRSNIILECLNKQVV